MKNRENKNLVAEKTAGNKSEKEVNKSIFYEILTSLKSGLFAFAIVLFLSISSKLLAFSTISSIKFEWNINDVIIAFWAFIIISFVILLSKYKSLK